MRIRTWSRLSKKSEESKETYRKYGLDELIYDESKRISIKHHPLLFFLGLLDTLEPTKYFYVVKPKKILESINIKLSECHKVINIEADGDIPNVAGWYEKIKGMEDWLAVKVNGIENYDNNSMYKLSIVIG